jgi:hypothetical protein
MVSQGAVFLRKKGGTTLATQHWQIDLTFMAIKWLT